MSTSIKSKIESLLFISPRPLAASKIASLIGEDKQAVKQVLDELFVEYQHAERGLAMQRIGTEYQMTTASENSKIIRDFLKDERTGELTKPSLETLTIIAYRGPITKAELDMIRGVNCSLILRNLMIKGLVESKEDKEKMTIYYTITFDFMRYLGITDIEELPDYQKLNKNENLEKLLHPEQAEREKADELKKGLEASTASEEDNQNDNHNDDSFTTR